jgi:hypothetical protein
MITLYFVIVIKIKDAYLFKSKANLFRRISKTKSEKHYHKIFVTSECI